MIYIYYLYFINLAIAHATKVTLRDVSFWNFFDATSVMVVVVLFTPVDTALELNFQYCSYTIFDSFEGDHHFVKFLMVDTVTSLHHCSNQT